MCVCVQVCTVVQQSAGLVVLVSWRTFTGLLHALIVEEPTTASMKAVSKTTLS